MIDTKVICDACGRVISHSKRTTKRRCWRTVEGKYFWELREAGIDLCYQCRSMFEPLFSLTKEIETDFNNVEKKYYKAREKVIEQIRQKANALGQQSEAKKDRQDEEGVI